LLMQGTGVWNIYNVNKGLRATEMLSQQCRNHKCDGRQGHQKSYQHISPVIWLTIYERCKILAGSTQTAVTDSQHLIIDDFYVKFIQLKKRAGQFGEHFKSVKKLNLRIAILRLILILSGNIENFLMIANWFNENYFLITMNCKTIDLRKKQDK